MGKNKVTILMESHEDITEESKVFLEKNNCELFYVNGVDKLLKNDQYLSSEALLVRGANISGEIIQEMPNLKVIARAGVGTDNIDMEAASRRKVYVCNVPDANFTSVAEHVMGMLLSLSHQLDHGNREIRKGHFNARHVYMGAELAKKTIGIIGFGRIGQLVAQKCVDGFEMKVLAYDPYIKETALSNVRLVESLDEIYRDSDFITLHLPYLPELHHLIDEEVLKKMKRTAYLINCARGGLVDEEALVKALNHGEIAGAGVDVFAKEPVGADYPLWEAENIIATPHMAASTHEALARMSMGAAQAIVEVFLGDKPKTALNKL